MKIFRGRIDIVLIVLALTGVIVWVSYGLINTGKEEKHFNVSVIVSNSKSNRWTAFREGLEQAADDDNVSINFVSSESVTSAEEQNALIDRELQNGADGIILEPYSSKSMSDIAADISSKAAVVLLDSDISPEGVYTTVMLDNTAVGSAIGQAVIKDLGKNLSNRKIGVICGNLNKNSMAERFAGFKSSISGYGGKIEWAVNDDTDLVSQLIAEQKGCPVDVLISLGNDETEAALDFILAAGSMHPPILLYGEGCSEKLVYYLDKGTIKTLIVPNEFNMGYQSLKHIAKLIKYVNSPQTSSKVDFLIINKDNLYDEDNQKVLFPIVQ